MYYLSLSLSLSLSHSTGFISLYYVLLKKLEVIDNPQTSDSISKHTFIFDTSFTCLYLLIYVSISLTNFTIEQNHVIGMLSLGANVPL